MHMVFNVAADATKKLLLSVRTKNCTSRGLSDRSEKTRGNRVLSSRIPQIRQVVSFLTLNQERILLGVFGTIYRIRFWRSIGT